MLTKLLDNLDEVARDERAAAETIGVLVLIAATVAAGSVVGAYAMDTANKQVDTSPPEEVIETDGGTSNPDTGDLTVLYAEWTSLGENGKVDPGETIQAKFETNEGPIQGLPVTVEKSAETGSDGETEEKLVKGTNENGVVTITVPGSSDAEEIELEVGYEQESPELDVELKKEIELDE
jgi:FlaG/FlaF family flagellin (archaellin)